MNKGSVKLSILILGAAFGFLSLLQVKAAGLTKDAQGSTVKVELKEWAIELDKTEVASGVVTFQVTNRGVENHELVVIKSDLPHSQLPTVDGKVDESVAGELIGEIEDFAPQGSFKASFTLAPGHYVLICNIVEKEPDGGLESHYHEGMHRAFKVVP